MHNLNKVYAKSIFREDIKKTEQLKKYVNEYVESENDRNKLADMFMKWYDEYNETYDKEPTFKECRAEMMCMVIDNFIDPETEDSDCEMEEDDNGTWSYNLSITCKIKREIDEIKNKGFN